MDSLLKSNSEPKPVSLKIETFDKNGAMKI